VAKRSLQSAIPAGASLVLDTSAALAYLTGTETTSERATELFDDCIATGRNRASLSVVTVQEILVRPFRAGPASIATAEGFLRHFAEIGLIEVTYEIAREAARIRAISEIRAPDALVMATAVVTDADLLVTNDRSWPNRAKLAAPDLVICLLADLGRG
jgi:predicted nucleic acid-binding protein